MEVKAGIDRLHLTFSTRYSLETVVSTLFEKLSLEKDFRKVKNKVDLSASDSGKKVSWYGTSYYLKTVENTTLIAIHGDPLAKFGKRNLVQIHGLAFSNSALNALRPFNLEHLVHGAGILNATVSAFDVYLDAIGGKIPVNQIRVQSLPDRYRRFVRSPFIRDRKREKTLPRQIGNTSIYYGGSGGNTCQILVYAKHLDLNQNIYSEENPLKFPWVRFELRLRKSTAKRYPLLLLLDNNAWFPEDQQTIGQVVADLFTKYFNFVLPTSNRVSRCPLQPWWSELLAAARTTSPCNNII